MTAAIRAMREACDLPPRLKRQFDSERAELDQLRAAIRKQIEADFDRIDRCLVVLDTLSGDEDREDGGDSEPDDEDYCDLADAESDLEDDMTDFEHSLGSLNGTAASCCSQLGWSGGAPYDLEDQHDGCEPDDGAEPALCGITVDERFVTGPAACCDGESEPSLASVGGTAKGCEGSQLQWSDGDRRDKEVDTGSRTHAQRSDDRYCYNPNSPLTKTKDALRKRREDADRARYAERSSGGLRLLGDAAGTVGRGL